MEELLQVAAIIAAVGAALAVLAKVGNWLVRRGRQVGHLLDDVLGEPAHGDQAERPSLMVRIGGIERRLAVVEAQVTPNSGSSMRDEVTRIGVVTGATQP